MSVPSMFVAKLSDQVCSISIMWCAGGVEDRKKQVRFVDIYVCGRADASDALRTERINVQHLWRFEPTSSLTGTERL